MRRAVLDEKNRLVRASARGGVALAPGQRVINVEIGDLPTDGSYRYVEELKTFVPAAARRPASSDARVLYLLARRFAGGPVSADEKAELEDWVEASKRRFGDD